MAKHPRIKMKLTQTDRYLETGGWFMLAVMWILAVVNYAQLPERIPIHYNALGVVDGWGGKDHIFTLPLIGSLLYAGITLLNRFPHLFNYRTRITEENAPGAYAYATRMLRYVNLFLVVVFTLILWKTIQTAKGDAEGLGSWFLPVFIGGILILGYFLVKKR